MPAMGSTVPSHAQPARIGRLVAALGALAALAILALATVACTGADTTLTFWAMGREGEVVTALLPEFERTHPGVHVRVQQLPWTSAHEKLLTAFVGEATPDVAELGNTWIAELVALHALAPLTDQVARSAIVQPADYFAGNWDSGVIRSEER